MASNFVSIKTMTENNAVKSETTALPIDLSALEDFLIRLQINIERAECILQDITECYLGNTEVCQKAENYWELISGYNEYSAKAFIISDYLSNLRKLGDEAEALLKSVS